MQARYYDPVIGRFLSSDPVGFAAGGPAYFNRYAYTANDPVNLIDRDGRSPIAYGLAESLSAALMERRAKREIDAETDLTRRRQIAQRYDPYLNHFRGANFDTLSGYERANRPTQLVDPAGLRYTQSRMSERMTNADGVRNSQSVDELARQLRTGTVNPQDIEPVRIFRDEDGVMRTLDHRRVEAAQRAGVPVNAIELTLDEARSIQGAAGQRARSGRHNTIRAGSNIRRPRG